MGIMGWVVVLFGLGVINFIIALSGLKGFLSNNQSIKSMLNLEELKSMVRIQMYQALVQIVILGIMGILVVVGIITGRLSFMEFLFTLVLNLVIFTLGKYGKGIEEQARSLDVEDKSLEEEYREVCETWVKKPFPNF
jgi:hypothetical protein